MFKVGDTIVSLHKGRMSKPILITKNDNWYNQQLSIKQVESFSKNEKIAYIKVSELTKLERLIYDIP